MAEVKDFEALKFLVENGFKEANLFWIRNSVFLLSNLAAVSAAFAYLTSSDTCIDWGLRVGIAAFGVLLCGVWFMVVRASRRMNHLWMDQAKIVAARLAHAEIRNALEDTPSDAVTKNSPTGATTIMPYLVLLFALAWVAISMVGEGGFFG